MASVPSIGDILMLSQLAWSAGRAFATARNDAPPEFANVEREAQALSKALRLLADAFQEDQETIGLAGPDLRQGISIILASAQYTLKDLESFVESYQTIRKEKTAGGFVVTKTWSDSVIKNYKIMAWTRDKGDIRALRNLLKMHANTINLTMQAMRSKSMPRIERTVMPMATSIDNLHDPVQDRLSNQLDELHKIITDIANGDTPSQLAQHSSPAPRIDSLFPSPVLNDRTAQISPQTGQEPFTRPRTPPRSPLRPPSVKSRRHGFIAFRPNAFDHESVGERVHKRQPSAGSESQYSTDEELADYFDGMFVQTDSRSSRPAEPPPRNPRRQSARTVARRDSTTLGAISLPPAYVDLESPPSSPEVTPATPLSLMKSFGRKAASPDASPITAPRSPSSGYLSPQALFMKHLLRNSAKLFDGPAVLMEVTQFDPEAPDPRFNTKLVELAKACHIYVVRRREVTENGSAYYATSIWTIADDFSVRVQQKLPEYSDTIPFHSFFDPEKISLGQETTLRLHAPTWGAQTLSEVETAWVNYLFASNELASGFQGAVFGRTLLDSFRTEKTLVLHDGLRGTFAFEEAMCVMERMRVFEEDGTCVPDAAGGFMAVIHLSASFADGWLKWWINSSRHPTRIKSDAGSGGGRSVKIRGVDVVIARVGPKGLLERRDGSQLRPPKKKTDKKRIHGIKIEFSTEEDKARFLAIVEKAMRTMLPLPDL